MLDAVALIASVIAIATVVIEGVKHARTFYRATEEFVALQASISSGMSWGRYIWQGTFGYWVLAGPYRSNLFVEFLDDSKTASPTAIRNFELTVASKPSIEIEILWCYIFARHGDVCLDCPSSLHLPASAGMSKLASGPSLLPFLRSLSTVRSLDIELCRERLQGSAFSQGFAIVQTSESMRQARSRFYFQCIHHGNSTAN
jgi:hypothetical protein